MTARLSKESHSAEGAQQSRGLCASSQEATHLLCMLTCKRNRRPKLNTFLGQYHNDTWLVVVVEIVVTGVSMQTLPDLDPMTINRHLSKGTYGQLCTRAVGCILVSTHPARWK